MNPLINGMLMASIFPKKNFNANMNAAISNGIDMSNRNAQAMFAVMNSNSSQEVSYQKQVRKAHDTALEMAKWYEQGQQDHNEKNFKEEYPLLHEARLFPKMSNIKDVLG